MNYKVKAALLAAGVITGGGLVAAGPASAATAPAGCVTHHQMGATKYVYYKGQVAASVKQYYGYCSGAPRNWAYVFVWDSFRQKYKTKPSAHIYSYTRGDYVGGFSNRTRGALNQQELKSKAFATTRECTSAAGWVDVYSKSSGAHLGYGFAYGAKVC